MNFDQEYMKFGIPEANKLSPQERQSHITAYNAQIEDLKSYNRPDRRAIDELNRRLECLNAANKNSCGEW